MIQSRLSFTWQKHIWAELNRWIKWIYRYPFDSGRDCLIEFGAVYGALPIDEGGLGIS